MLKETIFYPDAFFFFFCTKKLKTLHQINDTLFPETIKFIYKRLAVAITALM